MAVLVVGFFGYIAFNKNSKDTNQTVDTSGGSSHTKGEGTSGVTLVEYGDFQCPTCGSYYPIMKEVSKKYKDQVIFQFRHFPLVQIHQNAMVAHRAAEAAGKQGKFWQMHDLLYERQQTWSESTNAERIMEDYATELALNIDTFKADFASSAVSDVITADLKVGQSQGVSATPSFVLDGVKIEELPRNVESFSKLIDEAIANKSN